LHRAAPSLSVPGLLVHGPHGCRDGEDGTRRDVARVGTRRKLRNEGHRTDGAERRRARGGCTGRRRRARVVESVFRSAEVGRTHRFPRGTSASEIANGTRGIARKKGRPRGDCARRSRQRAKRCGSWGASLSPEVRNSSRFMRASLVGIASGGVRARRLGKSQGRERMTIRFDGRVPGPVDAPL